MLALALLSKGLPSLPRLPLLLRHHHCCRCQTATGCHPAPLPQVRSATPCLCCCHRWDDDVVVAAQLALRFEGCTPNNEAWAAVKGLSGAEVVRKALAALRNNTNEEVGVQGTIKDRSSQDTGTLNPVAAIPWAGQWGPSCPLLPDPAASSH
jgi:hypothetical protein